MISELRVTVAGRPAPQGSKRLGGAGQLREQSAYLPAWRLERALVRMIGKKEEVGKQSMWQDFATIMIANLASFSVGELLNAHRWFGLW